MDGFKYGGVIYKDYQDAFNKFLDDNKELWNDPQLCDIADELIEVTEILDD